MSDSDPVRVDPDALQPETLRRLLEEIVTRDGTDYGEIEVPIETRVASAMAQLRRGEAFLYFDPGTETVALTPRELRGSS